MTTDIAGHDIHWWVKSKGVTELSDFERDRIADLISEGYTQGEINMQYTGRNGQYYETRGCWSIVNWKDIALQLYNANTKTKFKAARKRFDQHWN
jgi:hypothetical protein